MQVREFTRRFGSKGAAVKGTQPLEGADATSALAVLLRNDKEALRLSVELLTQMREAGLAASDPRVNQLPAAIALARRAVRAGALWD